MEYQFSITSFFIGILILAAGAAFIRFHQVIADNFGSGVASYDRYKLWGLIACGLGLVVMVNLHVVILGAIFGSIFNR